MTPQMRSKSASTQTATITKIAGHDTAGGSVPSNPVNPLKRFNPITIAEIPII